MTDIKLSQDLTVSQPKPPHMYMIADRDWQRLKRLTVGIIERKPIFQTLAGVCFGTTASAAFALIAFYYTPHLPSWVIPTSWSILVAPTCLGAAFLILDGQQAKVARSSVKSVLDEYGVVEQDILPPVP